MEEKLVNILNEMAEYLSISQMKKLQEVLLKNMKEQEENISETSNYDYLKTWILGNVTRIPRHELPQTLDFSDFLPLFT